MEFEQYDILATLARPMLKKETTEYAVFIVWERRLLRLDFEIAFTAAQDLPEGFVWKLMQAQIDNDIDDGYLLEEVQPRYAIDFSTTLYDWYEKGFAPVRLTDAN